MPWPSSSSSTMVHPAHRTPWPISGLTKTSSRHHCKRRVKLLSHTESDRLHDGSAVNIRDCRRRFYAKSFASADLFECLSRCLAHRFRLLAIGDHLPQRWLDGRWKELANV